MTNHFPKEDRKRTIQREYDRLWIEFLGDLLAPLRRLFLASVSGAERLLHGLSDLFAP